MAYFCRLLSTFENEFEKSSRKQMKSSWQTVAMMTVSVDWNDIIIIWWIANKVRLSSGEILYARYLKY